MISFDADSSFFWLTNYGISWHLVVMFVAKVFEMLGGSKVQSSLESRHARAKHIQASPRLYKSSVAKNKCIQLKNVLYVCA